MHRERGEAPRKLTPLFCRQDAAARRSLRGPRGVPAAPAETQRPGGRGRQRGPHGADDGRGERAGGRRGYVPGGLPIRACPAPKARAIKKAVGLWLYTHKKTNILPRPPAPLAHCPPSWYWLVGGPDPSEPTSQQGNLSTVRNQRQHRIIVPGTRTLDNYNGCL